MADLPDGHAEREATAGLNVGRSEHRRTSREQGGESDEFERMRVRENGNVDLRGLKLEKKLCAH